MTIQLYNTMSGQKEPFETLQPNLVKMYVCGPTVYSDAHVGHARFLLVFDIVRRYLEYRGYDVRYIMNYTDVDDKIINRANEEGIDAMVLSQRYIDQFEDNLEGLRIKPATAYPRVSELMPEIVAFISELIDKGFAYELNGSIYFSVTKDAEYGKLSNRTLDDARSGTRTIHDDDKQDPADFALWKSAKPGEAKWDSPWGEGRPGWHIECSAMNLHLLGEQIDIHGGGNDLIFPHHENEIAQTEALTGKPFARYWMHNGMLQLESGEKMSKSLNNFFTINDFLAEYSADVLRMIILNSGYRNPLTYGEEVIEQAKSRVDRLASALKPARPDAAGAPAAILSDLASQTQATHDNFVSAMDDDFNTAGALGFIFELVKRINQARDEGATDAQMAEAQNTLAELTSVLGLTLEESAVGSTVAEPFVELLVEMRQELRAAKQWALADSLRDRLITLGVVIEDSASGSTWHWSR